MPLEIDGVVYIAAGEVAEQLRISRQTLWRWRQEGKIPSGHRYRDRQLLFTESEFESVKQYSHRLEPVGVDGGRQLRLFEGAGRGGRR